MTKHMDAEVRRAQILGAAKVCFIRKGYFDTKVDEIAKEAALSKGGVYFHFDSKRDIFMALVEDEHTGNIAFVDQVAVGTGTMMEKLNGLGSHFMERFSTADQARWMTVVYEMSLHDEEVRHILLDLEHRYVAKIQLLVEESIKNNEIEVTDSLSIAFLLKALIDGVQSAHSIGFEYDPARLLSSSLQLVIRGLGGKV